MSSRLTILFCLPFFAGIAQDLTTVKNQAEHFFTQGNHALAIQYAEQLLEQKPSDHTMRFQLALSYMYLERFQESKTQFIRLLDTDKRRRPDCFYWLGKLSHSNHQFQDAIGYYKNFLKETDQRDERLPEVKFSIQTAANGLSHRIPDPAVLVENMGKTVNSPFDEYAPIESPNVLGRVYFTSYQKGVIVDQFSESGDLVASKKVYNADMLYTEISEGTWSKPDPLNTHLNSPADEVLLEFKDGGKVVFYQQFGDRLLSKVDTFGLDNQKKEHIWVDPPYGNHSINGIHFFSDSVVLFAANLSSGFGGFDLYISVFSNAQWSEPINLGPQVNSLYDEITPFLSRDGRNLFFSSNRNTSMGGHDIFRAKYRDRTIDWSVENLGMPINSASDDYCYRISRNGTQAFLASNRVGGNGGFDLYSVYFQNPQYEQLNQSIPSYFLLVPDYQQFIAQFEDQPSTQEPEIGYDVPQLFYNDGAPLLTDLNQDKIDQIAGFLQSYSHAKIEILSFSDQSIVSNFDLFFAAQRAEEIKSYLEDKSISSDRIFIKSYGGNYPLAINEINGQPNPASQYFNRRIDFVLHSVDNLPVSVHYAQPRIAETLRSNQNEQLYAQRKQLTFTIEFARLSQMYKGSVIAGCQDCFVALQPNEPTTYSYCSGQFSSFSDALNRLSEIRETGVQDAKIIPYINGLPLETGKINEELINRYPEVKEYLIYLK